MESTRTNSLNKGLETLGALITRAKSSFQNGRAHHSTNETKWQHILVRNNVESSIMLCVWSLFPPDFPSLLLMHMRKDGDWASAGRKQGRRTHNHWHLHSALHMYLGRLDHLNCPLECSPVWKWMLLWRPVLVSARERLTAISPFNTACPESQTLNWRAIFRKQTEKFHELKRTQSESITRMELTVFFACDLLSLYSQLCIFMSHVSVLAFWKHFDSTLACNENRIQYNIYDCHGNHDHAL